MTTRYACQIGQVVPFLLLPIQALYYLWQSVILSEAVVMNLPCTRNGDINRRSSWIFVLVKTLNLNITGAPCVQNVLKEMFQITTGLWTMGRGFTAQNVVTLYCRIKPISDIESFMNFVNMNMSFISLKTILECTSWSAQTCNQYQRWFWWYCDYDRWWYYRTDLRIQTIKQLYPSFLSWWFYCETYHLRCFELFCSYYR